MVARVCERLNISKLEKGVKYEIVDGEINDYKCKYIMLRDTINFDDDDGLSLFNMLLPYMKNILDGDEII